MFTGIIESVGKVTSMQPTGGDIRLTIASDDLDFSDVKLGDSIASNGICLTVVEIGNNSYSVDVSRETIARTALEELKAGHIVNLEKAMLPTTRFGGHIVAGHVDGVGRVRKLQQDARSIYIEIEIPKELAHYTATKGSITVDGISLTTNLVRDNIVCLNIIPHTAKVTNIAKHWLVGSKVNIEVDIVARYLERLLNKSQTGSMNAPSLQSQITEDFLADNGFMK
ncbi:MULTISPECIES: riboflavin synthase [unclassified Psychrobacter]|uniref:riboflavin synthase n=1 Tax=unclassified Psychrobacter TaxID=196806 RepID=UPI00071E8727|nr:MULTISPECIES: riboflavin synthase [unclassified Psychrobacter]OLF37387.1 riboflavin synthase subunit alpha [Psychrobacter sp. Cmf 22.2]